MVLTQQLARISPADLGRCQVSVEDLHRVCSFALPAAQYLDLDRASAQLIEISGSTGVADRVKAALERAMSGDDEVNSAYRKVAEATAEHPVSSLEPAGVSEVYDALRALSATGFPSRHPAYLGQHFRALVKFYEDCNTDGSAVVMWWDGHLRGESTGR